MITDPYQTDCQGSNRNRRFRLALLSSLITKPLAVVIQLVTVPLFLNYLGNEEYGLYETILALSTWFSLINLGTNLVLLNRLIDCYVSGDKVLARRYVSTIFYGFVCLALTGSILITIFIPFFPWELLIYSNNISTSLLLSIYLVGLLTLSSIILDIPSIVYTGYQEISRNNYWDAASKIAILIASFGISYSSFGLMGVLLAVTGSPMLIRTVNLLFMVIWEKKWICPNYRLFDRRIFLTMLADGLCFFILQMSIIIIYQTDKLLIALMIDPAHVTGYAILARVFFIVHGTFMLVLSPLWPAYGEAIRRGDLVWVQRSLGTCLWVGCLMMITCGTIILIFGKNIFDYWTHGQVFPVSNSLILAMTASYFFRVWIDCQTIIISTTGILIPQVFFFAMHATLNIAFSIILAPHYGVEGIAWTIPITALLTSVWGYPWLLHRYLGVTPTFFPFIRKLK